MRRVFLLMTIFVALSVVSTDAFARDRFDDDPYYDDYDDGPEAYLTAGVGMGEILHAEIGYFVLPRLTVDASWGWVIFNHLIGIGATGYLFGDVEDSYPPRHSLAISGRFRLNPLADPVRISPGGGETIPATAELYVGWAWHTDSNFLLRVYTGMLLYSDDGLAAGPNFLLSLGYAF